jgi:rod shape determining protein RodA
MFDRRLLQCFDWGLLALTLAIGAAGLVALYSAVSAGAMANRTSRCLKNS